MKRVWKNISIIALGLTLAACGQNDTTSVSDKKELRIGMPPSAHNVLVEKVVKPQLEKEGYTIKLINFSSLRDANTGLVEGGIDLHTAQHQAYLDVYRRETGNDLVSIVHTPSIPAFLYSTKQTSLDAIKEGDTILIPNDPSNAARSYALLAKIGLIGFEPDAELAALTEKDIVDNPKNLQFKEVDSALIPRLLDEIDYGIMPGGVAWLGGISADHALAHETFLPELELMVTVRKADEETKWAQDVKKAFQSDEMREFIDSDPEMKGWFVWPQG